MSQINVAGNNMVIFDLPNFPPRTYTWRIEVCADHFLNKREYMYLRPDPRV